MIPSAFIAMAVISITQSSSADSVDSVVNGAASGDLARPMLLIAGSIALGVLALSLFLLERVDYVSGYVDLKRGLRGTRK